MTYLPIPSADQLHAHLRDSDLDTPFASPRDVMELLAGLASEMADAVTERVAQDPALPAAMVADALRVVAQEYRSILEAAQ